MLEVISCSPKEKLWNPIEGKCSNRQAYQVALAGTNMESEMLIMLLPQRIIWTLNLTMKQRLGLSMSFALRIARVFQLPLSMSKETRNRVTYRLALNHQYHCLIDASSRLHDLNVAH
jgi:hypothetical protein